MKKKSDTKIHGNDRRKAPISDYKIKIPVVYSIFGLVWASISDFYVIEILDDKYTLRGVSFLIDLIYIILTSILIYKLIRKGLKEIQVYKGNLDRNEEIYRSLYNAVSGGIIVFNTDEAVINVNSVACEIFGMETNKLIGMKHPNNDWHAVHEDGSPFMTDEYPHKISLSTGEHVKQIVMGITNEITKEKRWILVNSEPIRSSENGEIEAAMATFLDITYRKLLQDKLKESEGQYRNLFNEMSEGFALREIICDNKGSPVDFKYIDFNRAYEKMIGFKKDLIINKRIMDVLPDFEKEWIDIYGKVALTGQPVKFQRYDHNFDKYLEVIAFCPEAGKFATLILDITNRINAEKEIKRLNEELEDRVVERTAQLEAANKELEAFSYSVSHDLRSPLRAIEGFSSILKEDYGNKLDSEGLRYLDIISRNTVQMGQLIDDLLSFSRMSRNNMGKEKIDMNELIKTVFNELIFDTKDREIILKLEDLPCAYGDFSMLRQVIINLISNSIKFTRTRKKAVIESGCMYDENGKVYYIKDNGVGFDMKYSDKLFGVFQRLHRADEYEGTGIGLAIVQRIIRRHGGRVWAEGKVNEGVTIFFTLD